MGEPFKEEPSPKTTLRKPSPSLPKEGRAAPRTVVTPLLWRGRGRPLLLLGLSPLSFINSVLIGHELGTGVTAGTQQVGQVVLGIGG